MNIAQSPTIRSGPRAGQPRPLVDLLIDKAHALKSVLIKIRNAGYHPIEFGLDGATPWVRVEPHRDFDRLVEEGEACQYIWRHREDVYQRVFDGVRVIWSKWGY